MTALFLVLLRILFPLDPVARLREITRDYINAIVSCLEDPARREAIRNTPHLCAKLDADIAAIVDTYRDIEQELGIDLEDIEEQVFSGDRVDSSTIYRLKREVLEFRRAAVPLAAPLHSLHADAASRVTETELRLLFRDVSDHLQAVIDHADSYDRLLTDVLSAHLAQVSVQQNNDMRRISAWVAIAAVPTMIAGIYGMNFEFMPELNASIRLGDGEFRYGYFVVLGVMAAVCAGLYRAFKRSGWL